MADNLFPVYLPEKVDGNPLFLTWSASQQKRGKHKRFWEKIKWNKILKNQTKKLLSQLKINNNSILV